MLYFSYSGVAEELDPLFQHLWNRGLVETSSLIRLNSTHYNLLAESTSALMLDECLKLLQQPDLQSLAKKFRLDHQLACHLLVRSLTKHASQRTVAGTSVGTNILQQYVAKLFKMFSS